MRIQEALKHPDLDPEHCFPVMMHKNIVKTSPRPFLLKLYYYYLLLGDSGGDRWKDGLRESRPPREWNHRNAPSHTSLRSSQPSTANPKQKILARSTYNATGEKLERNRIKIINIAA